MRARRNLLHQPAMKRLLWIIIRLLIAALIVVYLADWAILRIRVARGTGYGTVQVDQYLSTPLKGNKAEYDYLGQASVSCARSIFPHGAPPCWWVERHKDQWE